MSETAVRQKIAQRRVEEFKHNFGKQTLHLAYYAAVPVVLNSELLHLLRINFFLDPPKTLPYTAETDLLLSPLCQEIGDELYEIESEARNILLRRLVEKYGHEDICKIASLLNQYANRQVSWEDKVELKYAQKITALNLIDPRKAKQWLEAARADPKSSGTIDKKWFVAIFPEIDRQLEKTSYGKPKFEVKHSQDPKKPLTMNVWTSITLILVNESHQIAQKTVLHLSDAFFEYKNQRWEQELGTIFPREQVDCKIECMPRGVGSTIPLQVTINFEYENGLTDTQTIQVSIAVEPSLVPIRDSEKSLTKAAHIEYAGLKHRLTLDLTYAQYLDHNGVVPEAAGRLYLHNSLLYVIKGALDLRDKITNVFSSFTQFANSLAREIVKVEDAQHELASDFDRVRIQKYDLDKKYTQIKSEQDVLENEYKHISSQRVQTNEQLTQTSQQKRSLENQRIQIDEQISDRQDRIKQTQQQKLDLATRRNQLPERMRILVNQISQIEKAISDLNAQFSQTRWQIGNLEGQLTEARKQISDLESRLRKVREEKHNPENELAQVERRIADLNRRAAPPVDRDEQLARAYTEKSALQKQLDPLRKRESDLQKQLEPLRKRENDLQRQLDPLRKRESDLQAQLTKANEEKNDLQNKRDQIPDQERNLDLQITQVEHDIDNLNKELTTFQKDKDNFDKQLVSASKQENNLKKQLNELTKQEKNLKKQLDQVNKEKKDCESELEEIRKPEHTYFFMGKAVDGLRLAYARLDPQTFLTNKDNQILSLNEYIQKLRAAQEKTSRVQKMLIDLSDQVSTELTDKNLIREGQMQILYDSINQLSRTVITKEIEAIAHLVNSLESNLQMAFNRASKLTFAEIHPIILNSTHESRFFVELTRSLQRYLVVSDRFSDLDAVKFLRYYIRLCIIAFTVELLSAESRSWSQQIGRTLRKLFGRGNRLLNACLDLYIYLAILEEQS